MNPIRRRLLPLVLLLVAYQFAHSYDVANFYLRGIRDPFSLRFSSRQIASVQPESAQAGLQPGDEITALNGQPFVYRSQFDELERTLRPGQLLHVALLRDGQPAEALVSLQPMRANAQGWLQLATAFSMDFLTRWLCLLFALFVLLARPNDPLAWLLTAMMLSFATLSSGFSGIADGWAQPWKALGVFYNALCQRTWMIWILLFGIYFPDPKSKVRLMAWARWVLVLPIFLRALAVALGRAWEASTGSLPEPLTAALNFGATPLTILSFCGIGIYFANLNYKAAKADTPDARRRLKLLYWGGNVSLTPMFLLYIGTWILRIPLEAYPNWLLLPCVLLLFLFPVTLAYVVVVERAMDLRVVIREGLHHVLAKRAVRVLTVLLGFLIMGVLMQVVSNPNLRRAERLRDVAWCVAAIVLLQKGTGRAQLWVDRHFFRDQVEAENALAALSDEVRHLVSPDELKDLVCARVSSALRVPSVRITPNGPGANFEIALPLRAGSSELGHLVLGRKLTEEPFTARDRQILASVASQTALALENARLTAVVAHEAARQQTLLRELEIAREVQQGLLPSRPPLVPAVDFAGRCRPAQSIGGDYYDFFLTQDQRLTLAIGDVCGKGVPAALLMASVQSSLRGLSAAGLADLGELMTRLNRLLYDATPRNRFVTLWCAHYDPATRLLAFVSAGHGDALLLRADGSLESLAARGLALGLTAKSAFTAATCRLEPGDTLAVCTDGVYEARNPAGDEFGEARWREALQAHAQLPVPALLDALLSTVDTFAAGALQHDDITLLALRPTPEVSSHE